MSVGDGKIGGRIWATTWLSDCGERVKDDVWGDCGISKLED